MHQMSPGVERAVAAARAYAEMHDGKKLRLCHFVHALLDDVEGRPAVLLEHAGLDVVRVRNEISAYHEAPLAPPEAELFKAARTWSIAYRHDPEFLTDALFIVVLRADPEFDRTMATFGLNSAQLERILVRSAEAHAIEDALTPNPSPGGRGVGGEGLLGQPSVTDEIDTARVLDAGFNRSREAARVLEDYCRFVLSDCFLTQQIKELRHALTAAATRLPPNLLLAARETQTDVGTSLSATGEYERRSPAEIAMINCKRLHESLRSLEEFGKLFAPELGRDLEALRYRIYTLEKAICNRSMGRERIVQARLYLLVTGAQCRAALDWTIEQAAAGGVNVVQLREKSLPDRELLARARDVRRWTQKAGVLFIVNDRPDIARLAEADGVHLGQDDMTIRDARRIVGAEALIGRSTHSLDQVRAAVLDGADYLGIGPVFPSTTKGFELFPGLEFVAAAVAETSIPAFALGGIGPANIDQVVRAGASRVAVSSAIASAEDPAAVSRMLRTALGEDWKPKV